MAESKKPDKVFSNKAIRVSVWKNTYVSKEDGKPFTAYSISYQRSYKKNEEWVHVSTIRELDLPIVIDLLQQAQTWINSGGQ